MAIANANQYPHVRALPICLACGGKKDRGLLVCWPCNNEFKILNDVGYGPQMDRIIAKADRTIEAHNLAHDLVKVEPRTIG